MVGVPEDEKNRDSRMSLFESKLQVPEGTYAEQEYRIRSGENVFLVLGGKMASGKDTLAPLLSLPGSETVVLSYGEVLRRQLLSVIPCISSFAKDDAQKYIRTELGYRPTTAGKLYRMVRNYLDESGTLDPWDRTDFHRDLLQLMGSDWLPDNEYLPRTAAKQVMQLIGEGKSVIITGGRFEADVDVPRLVGALTVRVLVDRETQLKRLKIRDGLEETSQLLEQLEHPGEVALDDYNFDVLVSNGEGAVVADVAHELKEKILEHVARRRAASSYTG